MNATIISEHQTLQITDSIFEIRILSRSLKGGIGY